MRLIYLLLLYLTNAHTEDTQAEAEKILNEYQNWLSNECQVNMNLFELVYTNNGTVELRAKADENTWSFTISKKCCLSSENAEVSNLEGLLKAFPQKDIHSILFHLITDLALPSSFWRPYMNYLTFEINTVLPQMWIVNDDIFTELAGLDLYTELGRIRMDFEKTWADLSRHFSSVFPDFFPDRIYNEKTFLNAALNIFTKGITIDGKLFLVPLLDKIELTSPVDKITVTGLRYSDIIEESYRIKIRSSNKIVYGEKIKMLIKMPVRQYSVLNLFYDENPGNFFKENCLNLKLSVFDDYEMAKNSEKQKMLTKLMGQYIEDHQLKDMCGYKKPEDTLLLILAKIKLTGEQEFEAVNESIDDQSAKELIARRLRAKLTKIQGTYEKDLTKLNAIRKFDKQEAALRRALEIKIGIRELIDHLLKKFSESSKISEELEFKREL